MKHVYLYWVNAQRLDLKKINIVHVAFNMFKIIFLWFLVTEQESKKEE